MKNKMGLIKKLQGAFNEGFSWAREKGYSKLYSEEFFQRHENDEWHTGWARSFGEGIYLFFHPLSEIYRLLKK